MLDSTPNTAVIVKEQDGVLTAVLTGSWTIDHAAGLDKNIQSLRVAGKQPVVVDCQGLTRLDTAGAILIRDLTTILGAAGPVQRLNLTPTYDHLLELVENSFSRIDCEPPAQNKFIQMVADIGRSVENAVLTLGELISFIGHVLTAFAGVLVRPWRFRFTSMIYQLEMTGLRALGIVGLISFLIGAVMVNQGAIQLAKFGADILVIDMLGITHLREMGVLLTSIIVAGRSGSAFTAQIGSMKLREEVDAMKTLGLQPMEVLVLPRVMALMIALPLLVVYADIMGVLGGATMASIQLDISFASFLTYMQEEVDLVHYWVGLYKAPVFAAVIAICGCFQGLSVHSSAESLGIHTTRAVVQGIFLVIVMDALFAVFFTMLDM